MKYDKKNALKLQISTYLEVSLSMMGRMMLEDIFNHIDLTSEEEAEAYVEAHYDDNIFDLIAPYLITAAEEYEIYKNTPEGQTAIDELKKVMEEAKLAAITYEATPVKSEDDGDGNVH